MRQIAITLSIVAQSGLWHALHAEEVVNPGATWVEEQKDGQAQLYRINKLSNPVPGYVLKFLAATTEDGSPTQVAFVTCDGNLEILTEDSLIKVNGTCDDGPSIPTTIVSYSAMLAAISGESGRTFVWVGNRGERGTVSEAYFDVNDGNLVGFDVTYFASGEGTDQSTTQFVSFDSSVVFAISGDGTRYGISDSSMSESIVGLGIKTETQWTQMEGNGAITKPLGAVAGTVAFSEQSPTLTDEPPTTSLNVPVVLSTDTFTRF